MFRRLLPPAVSLSTAVLLMLFALPGQAVAARDVPVGLANTNEQNLRNPNWLYAIRFVVDRDTTMYRFFSQMKAKGASWDEHVAAKCTTYGAGCYGAGDGGLIEARLVTVKPDGTPDLSNVLAREVVNPQKRYFETKSAYGISTISLFWYFNMGGVQVKAGTPYAMVYRNLHADPAHNFSSPNSPTVKDSESGPNGRNNMDPNAPGAIAGLDPREAVAWSVNGGSTWTWGRQVGPYYGSTTSDDGTRLPHYAWQSSPLARVEANQPYAAYFGTCTACTLTAGAVPRATTLTEAGGYAPVGASVGVVTVRNLRTGATGRTAALGSGIERGRLDTPVYVAVGDSYQITHTGTVYKGEADNYLVRIVSLGTGAFPFTTGGNGADRAELFALPHPYYAASTSGPAPAPAPTPAPAPAPTPAPAPAPVEPVPAPSGPATASSSQSSSLAPRYAVDGSERTRWGSAFRDNQWWQVDLGSARQVDRVEVVWEDAYASRYKILTSLDGVNFSVAADVSNDRKGLRATRFTARAARYVRIQGVTRATQYGISFWEVRTYGPAASVSALASEPSPKSKPRRSASGSTIEVTLAVAHSGQAVRLRGRVKGVPHRRVLKVRVQARLSGRWRTVAGVQVGSDRRYALRWKAASALQSVRVRAVLPDGTRSRSARVRLR